MRWKVLLIALFAILIAWFTLVNATTVTVDFLFTKRAINLVFVILISALLGMSLMAALWSARAWKMRRTTKSLKQQIKSLEGELAKAHQELADLHEQLADQAEQAAEAAKVAEASQQNVSTGENQEPDDAQDDTASSAETTTESDENVFRD